MAVRGDARDRHGENGGGQVGHGEFARAGVLDPHRDGEDHNHGVSDSGGQRIGAECSEDNPRHKEHSLDRSGSAEELTSVSGESRSYFPTDEGPDSEGGYGRKRCRDGESRRSHQRKSQEHDVACHVGDEE
jgi:hypothetical protein